jgi:hypothetical protein
MTGPDSDPGGSPPAPDPLIGIPERNSAEEALETHLIEKRLDPGEYGRRVEAAQLARTQSELMRLFSDLPVPHPTLPASAEPPAEAEDEPPPAIFFAGCLTLALGLPVAVVLGFVYGTWWTLAVPVAATAAMAYVEHLRTASWRQRTG